ncbi:MAG: hypothetical protein N3A66_08415, partial [Planctomycetota bacterium]|nr:hypothetical protein [Planctomycetota bacterium]
MSSKGLVGSNLASNLARLISPGIQGAMSLAWLFGSVPSSTSCWPLTGRLRRRCCCPFQMAKNAALSHRHFAFKHLALSCE